MEPASGGHLDPASGHLEPAAVNQDLGNRRLDPASGHLEPASSGQLDPASGLLEPVCSLPVSTHAYSVSASSQMAATFTIPSSSQLAANVSCPPGKNIIKNPLMDDSCHKRPVKKIMGIFILNVLYLISN